jgi:hypothetical protein
LVVKSKESGDFSPQTERATELRAARLDVDGMHRKALARRDAVRGLGGQAAGRQPEREGD